MKKIILAVTALLVALPVFAKISFDSFDINGKNELVYTINYETTGSWNYKSSFYTKLSGDTTKSKKEILSCFPEQMEVISLLNKPVLQIRNRFGTARYYTATDSFSWIKQNEDIPLAVSVTTPYIPNSTGKWVCYIQKSGIATGKLILENTSSGKKVELCDDILYSYDSVPVKWSNDGSLLVYEKKNNVYFCSPDALGRGVEVEERYRRIGRGSINSVEWASEKYLVYIDDYIVYRINSRELYTTSLYAGIIGQGTAIGRLPFQFNTTHDNFSVSPDAASLVIAQDKKNFTYFKTLVSSCDYMDILYSKPYTDSKASLADYSIFWDKNDEPILWLEKLPFNSTKVQGSVIKLGETSRAVLEIEDSGKPVLSPDRQKVAFFAGSTLYVYDINNWNKVSHISGEKIICIVWESDNAIYIGGENTIRKWICGTDKTDTITLSSARCTFWDSSSSYIIAETENGKRYAYAGSSGKWKPSNNTQLINQATQNGNYRGYCGTTANPYFENALYIRTLTKKAVTKPLYESSTKKMAERQKVALIFDAYDNADGLPKIISSLSKFNIPGTFFLNGEFIRRYPSQTKQIALNGYECASMFFTTTNLADTTFIVDDNFIARGLGRNEDEFFLCTGSELSLFWHAPYYESNSLIEEAGKAAGYEYIRSQHLHSDNITLHQIQDGKAYLTPEKLIEEYVDLTKATKGGVIPVTIGISQGNLPTTLWEHIDLLINTLLDENFELVSVSKL
ncbi:MAG: polysaccharide deacetylase family protein [Treponema sp.]|nr:polysaccharide deacetylase family protein [Treponema sp.]